MAKKNAKKTVAINANLRKIIDGAASIGYNVSGAFEGGVALAKSLAKNKAALNAAAPLYKAGYIVRNLESEPSIVRAWGNMSLAQRIERAIEIQSKATPESAKADRRTAREHKAVRAADVSWAGCKRKAGIIAEKAGNRKPRPSANTAPTPAQNVVGASVLVKASPKFTAAFAKERGFETPKAAANDYFVTAAAALLTTCDKNAALIPPQLTSAVSDFKAAIGAYIKSTETIGF